MCRNIRTLHHFKPPATESEIRASALQYVRKLSGMNRPSQANAAAFEDAIEEVAAATRRLFDRLESHGPARTRELEAARGRERWERRAARLKEGAGT